MRVSSARYGTVAIVFHWTIALAILAMLPLGWWMTSAINDPANMGAAFKAYQIHKSIGLTVLVLSVLRLLWRLTHPVPPLPPEMKGWEKLAAHLTHIGFYILIIALPLTGWIYVSAGWSASTDSPFAIPTIWFGYFEWPHISMIAGAGDATRSTTARLSLEAHEWLGWGATALIVLHVAAALKHHLVNHDDVLNRMLPRFRRD